MMIRCCAVLMSPLKGSGQRLTSLFLEPATLSVLLLCTLYRQRQPTFADVRQTLSTAYWLGRLRRKQPLCWIWQLPGGLVSTKIQTTVTWNVQWNTRCADLCSSGFPSDTAVLL